MKISQIRTIDFKDIDSGLLLTLHSLVKFFQEASIAHSNKAGLGPKDQLKGGSVWILHQFGIEVHKWPVYEEKLEIFTWHRGMQGIKTYREFELYSGKDKIATASGAYLYFDKEKRKVRRLPKDADQRYGLETQIAFKDILEEWRPLLKFEQAFDVGITLRLSDFDPLGHVNNSVYYDFVETLLFSYLGREIKIKKIKIQYAKEINKSVKTVQAGLIEDKTGYKFKIFDENNLFSFGEIEA